MNVFCTSGNSHCLFTEGTPENLYGIKTKRRPLTPITRRALANQITDTDVYPHSPRPIKPKTFKECRICKLLEASGNHGGIPYVNHYGRYPHFCPQWTQMDIIERRMTALEAGYCLQCFDPKTYITNGLDIARHQQHGCLVKTTKYKLTCSNEACLQHP